MVAEISLTKNLEKKKKGQTKGRTNRRMFICNPTIQLVEISLTKNLERKKKGQTQGRTNRRMPICNPTIQLVFVDLYTKYEVSILNGCGDIFDETFGKKEKGTNTRKNK